MNVLVFLLVLSFFNPATSFQQCTAVSALTPYHVCEANATAPGSNIAATVPSGCPPNSQTLIAGSGLVTDCKCLAGYYGTVGVDGNVASCTACARGSYSLAIGQPTEATCVTCPAGQYCGSISALPVACPPGTYSGSIMAYNSSVCIPFPSGFYGNVTGATSMAQASACPVGSFSNSLGAVDNSVCSSCPLGQYCLTVGTDPAPCINLPAYAHYLGSGTLPDNCPWACDTSYYLSANGTQCVACPPGSWCRLNMQNQCPFNSFSDALSDSQNQCLCVAGYFGDGSKSGTSPCSLCRQGQYCAGGNANISITCPDNSSSPFGSNDIMDCQCIPGYVGGNGTACALCEPDTVCLSGNLSHCPAHSSAPAGSSSITSCVSNPGYYAYFLGDTPIQCPVGFFCPGGLTITRCTDNAISPPGSMSAMECFCDRGYEGVNNSICVACDPGTWCWTGILNHCPDNSNSSMRSSFLKNCTCNPGYSGNDGDVCSPCLPGMVKPSQGSENCTSCVTGSTYQTAAAATSCVDCTVCPDAQFAGQLCVADADVVCAQCPDNFQCSLNVKTACPFPSVSHNASSYLDCRCPEGTFGQVLSDVDAQCGSCPLGAFCPAVVTTCSC